MSLKTLRERWHKTERETEQEERVSGWEGKRASAQEWEWARRVQKRAKGTTECEPLQVFPFLWHPYQVCATKSLGTWATAAQADGATRQVTVSLDAELGQEYLLGWLKWPASAYLIYWSPSGHPPCFSARRVTATSPWSVFGHYTLEEISCI